MGSKEKIKQLIEIDRRNYKEKIETVQGDVFICVLDGFAEDEEDFAYSVTAINGTSAKPMILEGNFIKSIEEMFN